MSEKCYRLRIMPLFAHELGEITAYIAYELRNFDAAQSLEEAVWQAIERRRTCAEAFEICYSSKYRAQPYYRIYVRNYIVFYTVEADVMEVRGIYYNRQNPPDEI